MDTESPPTFPVAPAHAPKAVTPPLPPPQPDPSTEPLDTVVSIGAVVPGQHLPDFVQRLIRALDRRGLPPEATALLSIAVAGVAATAFAMGHAGAGGLFADEVIGVAIAIAPDVAQVEPVADLVGGGTPQVEGRLGGAAAAGVAVVIDNAVGSGAAAGKLGVA